ncbi:Gfo/Idh/MocA family protein [Aquiflexum gelatinilyticum]|uniref:Gfo/Idh/MocA family protein n=1 Tax=Aquiflexum gelatinilyticum TaxID=2961943 RepID=UPI0021672B02|nr:Gfo/Idh/MocA family oxidoreductase [Aquiflexum gelatinilyticum]MCS4436905.1 Gfo/Idh/MocA family oxidoreductase [Aquiflexum gelatinilyticum]
MKKIQDQEVRWGVLGVGNVCEVKSAPAMKHISHSKLVAVMRRDEAKVKDYALRHGVPKWYTSAEELVHDPEVNAVYIATPPHMHLPLTRLVAAAGKPVYVEKPMARTYAECREMIAICEEAGVPLYVAYYRRALPHFLKIKELMESGAIGAIRTVHINLKQVLKPDVVVHLENNWRINPEIAGGGYFFDLASHQLDLLDFFFGPVIKASGFSSNQAKAYNAEDIVTGSFVFENGVLGSGNWCFTTSKTAEIDEIIIYGSKGLIRFETFGKGEFTLESDQEDPIHYHVDLPKHIQQPLIKTIVEDLLGTGTCPSTGRTAARTNWVMGEMV